MRATAFLYGSHLVAAAAVHTPQGSPGRRYARQCDRQAGSFRMLLLRADRDDPPSICHRYGALTHRGTATATAGRIVVFIGTPFRGSLPMTRQFGESAPNGPGATPQAISCALRSSQSKANVVCYEHCS